MKTVLITGGSRGIGAACVRLFAEKGCRVYFTYSKSHEQAHTLSKETGACGILCDQTKEQDIQSLMQALPKTGVDILVNNAGFSFGQRLLTDITAEEWNQLFAVNVTGTFLVTRAILPGMIHRKNGAIVNISSMWGVSGGSCEVDYSASKAAIIGFTKALAKEVGPSGIRVNCIAPGVINTEMNGHLSAEDLACLSEETSLCRIGTSEETARAVWFLSNDDSSFITGQVLGVDGGFV